MQPLLIRLYDRIRREVEPVRLESHRLGHDAGGHVVLGEVGLDRVDQLLLRLRPQVCVTCLIGQHVQPCAGEAQFGQLHCCTRGDKDDQQNG